MIWRIKLLVIYVVYSIICTYKENVMTIEEKKLMNAILARPGQEPEICQLPMNVDEQIEEISNILDGNIGSTEFFDIGNGASLWILVNDFAVPLGLKPNRHLPGKDQDEILFGNIIFIAIYNEESEFEGSVDMPEHVCRMFIEQIKQNFKACNGDEKPRSQDEVYIEFPDSENERSFKWREIEKPKNVDDFIPAGRAKLIKHDAHEIIEINGRYFRQVTIATKKTPLQ